jgi:hypothetical protein
MPTSTDGTGFNKSAGARVAEKGVADRIMHPAWRLFIEYCSELNHGEIEVLKIQDGLPVLAEVTKKKVKFAR